MITVPIEDKQPIEEGKEIVTTASTISIEETVSEDFTNKESNNTKFCSNCGKSIDINAEICPECGVRVSNTQKTEKFCSNCGKSIDINAEICPKCGVRVANPPNSLDKNPALAAILSFFVCGLGQIYNGELGKGLGLLIGFWICIALSLLILPILIAVVLWIYGIYDAYNTAQEMNY